MAGPLPEGGPAPADGALPDGLAAARAAQPLSLYLHIPWCRARCGYCDFNTYVPADLAAAVPPYLAAVRAEIGLAARVLGPRRVVTVYLGGGTPSLLPAAAFDALLGAVRAAFDLAPDAEVTTEANPESLSPALLDGLRAAGVNRLSLGWQSARPHVLATLGRAHTPGRAAAAVGWARAAGFPSVSLDLVYGAPGETPADWAATVEAALAAQPDHVSAYALTVEAGTPLAARMARGELPRPDDDDLADKYEWADTRLAAAGRPWYEISNWARPGHACRHNLAYWRSADWWGLGAGAHSHVGGLRWWNCRHPAAYAEALAAGRSPAAGREQLTERQRRWETVMLTLRLAEGLAAAVLDGPQLARAERWAADGLAEFDGSGPGRRLRLTRRGRLLADRVAADLVD